MQSKSINPSGQYRIDNKVLQPDVVNSEKPFKYLLILPSKKKGRFDYLAVKFEGDYKPHFISSIYEPRTPDGWFNFEYNGVRYEVKTTPEGKVVIYEYKSRQ